MRALPIIVLLAACEDVPQPYDLDHARVMAVRVDPPAAAPGERATVEVLVTDSTAAPYVATDVSMRDVVAGPEPGVVLLDIHVGTADGPLVVQKAFTIGTRRENPAAPVIVTPLEFVDGEKVTIELAAPDPALVYRWFSSVGDLTGFTTPAARIDPKAGEGFIVVVVRDLAGGTAWTVTPATSR
jgi:hypothetical protein